jgi:hypothetical protein
MCHQERTHFFVRYRVQCLSLTVRESSSSSPSFSFPSSPMQAGVGGGFKFSSKASSGAVLVLPKGGSSSQYFATSHLEMFIEKHSENWFSFVKRATLESIRKLEVIVGVHHATSWALASYSSESSSAGLSLKLMVGPVAAVDDSYNLSWESLTSCDRRVCDTEQCSRDAHQNQAIFVTSVHIYNQSRSWLKEYLTKRPVFSRTKGGRADGREDGFQGGSGSTSQPSGADQSSFSPGPSHHSPSPNDGLDHIELSRASDTSSTSTSRINLPASEETTLSSLDHSDSERDAVSDPWVSIWQY